MRIISGGRWTADGRWVVIAEWLGLERIVFDPDNGDPWLDLMDCFAFVNNNKEA